MKIVRLFLPGEYEDAHFYMGQLLILTQERSLVVYSLSKLGPVFETYESVILFTPKDLVPIVETEALSIRAFPRSKIYQNIIVVTTENGIVIAGIYDETA